MNKQSAPKDVASVKGYQQSRKGKRPIRVHNLIKKAADQLLEKDPLIQYLKKVAADEGSQGPLKNKVDDAGSLETNEDNLPLRKPIVPLTVMNPGPTPDMEAQARNPLREYLDGEFDRTPGALRKKYTDKDREVPKDMKEGPELEELKI